MLFLDFSNICKNYYFISKNKKVNKLTKINLNFKKTKNVRLKIDSQIPGWNAAF